MILVEEWHFRRGGRVVCEGIVEKCVVFDKGKRFEQRDFEDGGLLLLVRSRRQHGRRVTGTGYHHMTSRLADSESQPTPGHIFGYIHGYIYSGVQYLSFPRY